MGKSATAKKRKQPDHGAASVGAPAVAPIPVRALKPRCRLFVIMWIVMALWVAFLLALYFKTVWPQRHPSGGQPSTMREAQ